MNYPSKAYHEVYSQPAAANMSLHAFGLLLGDLKSLNAAESEHSVAFKRDVLSVLRTHSVTAANMNMLVHEPGNPLVIGNGQTLFQCLLTEVPWNVVLLMRDWMLRLSDTGYDYVAAWIETQEFQDS